MTASHSTDRPSRAWVARTRDALAELVLDRAAAQMIAADAGLTLSRINWQGTPQAIWHVVLRRASVEGRLDALLAAAIDRYPNAATLHDARRERDEAAGDGRGAGPPDAGERLRMALGTPARPPRDPRNEALAALADYARRSAEGAAIESAFVDRPIPLGELYVELALSHVDPEYDRALRRIASAARLAADATRHRFDLRAHRRLTVAELMTVGHRVQVVLGDPGSGKTTLLQYIRCHVARNDYGPRAVAFVVPLRHFARAGRGRGASLTRYACEDILGLAGGAAREGEALLHELASRGGRVSVLLDGLDEVSVDEGALARVREALRTMPEGFDAVVTSRRAGYPVGLLSPTRTVEVVELSDAAIRALITNWHRHIDSVHDPGVTRAFIASVFDQEALWSMARNPCLLSLLCYLRQSGGLDAAAEGRTELYRRAVELLRRRRPGQHDAATSGDLDELARFAAWLFGRDALPRQMFTRHDLERYAREHDVRDEALAGRWLDTRLLAQWNSDDTFLFTHLTFQEWFVARRLDALPFDELARVVDIRAHDPYWREVLRFFAGFCRTHSDGERRFARAVEPLLRPLDAHRLSLLSVAAWAAEFGAERAERVLNVPLRAELFAAAAGLPVDAAVPADEVDDGDTFQALLDASARAVAQLDPPEAAACAVAAMLEAGDRFDFVTPSRWPEGIPRPRAPLPLISTGRDREGVREDFALKVLAHVHSPAVQSFLTEVVTLNVGADLWDPGMVQSLTSASPAAAVELIVDLIDSHPEVALRMASSMNRSPIVGDAIDRAFPPDWRGTPWATVIVALALATHGHPRAVTLAARVLAERSPPEARHEAVIALSLLDIEPSTRALVASLDRCRRPSTVTIVLEALCHRPLHAVAAPLHRFVGWKDPQVRWAALTALARRRHDGDLCVLRRCALESSDDELRVATIEVARKERLRAFDDVVDAVATRRGEGAATRAAARLARIWCDLTSGADAVAGRAASALAALWGTFEDDRRQQLLKELGGLPTSVLEAVTEGLRVFHRSCRRARLPAAFAALLARAASPRDREWLLDRLAVADESQRAVISVALAGVAPDALLGSHDGVLQARLVARAVRDGVLFYADGWRSRSGEWHPYPRHGQRTPPAESPT